jgi:flagellar hook-associated protein 1
MGDMLSSAASGLLAFQKALNTTSHNIANVNTEGFSRQRVTIGTRTPEAYTNGFVGSGADVRTIERLYDEFVGIQARTTSSSLERLNIYSDQVDNLNNLFSDSSTGLSALLQQFKNSFQDVANAPSSTPARQVVLSQAQSFVDRLKAYDSRLSATGSALNTQLADEAVVVSALAQNIAELNQRIEIDQSRTGQPPNDLLDQRDHLLNQLATHVSVQVTKQDNGQVIVAIGSGQPLVVGNQFFKLAAAPDTYDSSRNKIEIQGLGPPVDITSRLSGGTIGGLLDFQRDVLDPARNSLGRITVALSETVNEQQRMGFDLNGAFGADLFAVGGVNAYARSSNSGLSSLAATRLSPSSGVLTDSNYILSYNGTAWALRNSNTGAAVTMSGAGTVGSPFIVDGMSLVVTGTAVTGDSYLIRPTQGAITGMSVLTSDPSKIAAAAPITTAASINNKGSGVVSSGEVTNVANVNLLTPATIQFLTATTYSINGGAAQAYTPGANISANGWQVQISGTPAINDVFTVSQNLNPEGDNRNAVLLSDALSKPILDGGTTSLNNASGRLVGSIGVATNQARSNRDAQQAIFNDNVAARDAISGVNLDEEAANLIRYQQAYQAAAQVISTASSLFDAVLAAVRR